MSKLFHMIIHFVCLLEEKQLNLEENDLDRFGFFLESESAVSPV